MDTFRNALLCYAMLWYDMIMRYDVEYGMKYDMRYDVIWDYMLLNDVIWNDMMLYTPLGKRLSHPLSGVGFKTVAPLTCGRVLQYFQVSPPGMSE